MAAAARTGETKSLPLTAGYKRAAFAEHRVEAGLHPHNERARFGDGERVP
jgi:hypothetical protein